MLISVFVSLKYSSLIVICHPGNSLRWIPQSNIVWMWMKKLWIDDEAITKQAKNCFLRIKEVSFELKIFSFKMSSCLLKVISLSNTALTSWKWLKATNLIFNCFIFSVGHYWKKKMVRVEIYIIQIFEFHCYWYIKGIKKL